MRIACSNRRLWAGVVLALSMPALLYSQNGVIPKTNRVKLEAVAETHLLMDGLLQSNFRGLNRLLKEPPPDQANLDIRPRPSPAHRRDGESAADSPPANRSGSLANALGGITGCGSEGRSADCGQRLYTIAQ